MCGGADRWRKGRSLERIVSPRGGHECAEKPEKESVKMIHTAKEGHVLEESLNNKKGGRERKRET